MGTPVSVMLCALLPFVPSEHRPAVNFQIIVSAAFRNLCSRAWSDALGVVWMCLYSLTRLNTLGRYGTSWRILVLLPQASLPAWMDD
jgi:hypothetical protein